MELNLVLCFIQIFLPTAFLQSTVLYPDIPFHRFGSRYWKNFEKSLKTFDEAQEACRAYGGSLAMFPTPNEATHLFDLMAIDMKIDVPGARDNPYLFWIGLKYEPGNLFWVNNVNENRINQSKWVTNAEKLPISSTTPAAPTGCQAVRLEWDATTSSVNGSLVPVACDTSPSVERLLCEKPINSSSPLEFWESWGRWSNENCDTAGAPNSTRTRMCYGYGCELKGLPEEFQHKGCCPLIRHSVANGDIDHLFSHHQRQAYSGQRVELLCEKGFVDSVARYRRTTYTCFLNKTTGAGQWSSTVPADCVPVDCGPPPLGVHALPPMYTGTIYHDIVTYTCQPGFKEPTNNQTKIYLKCGNDDTWVGLDNDVTAKPVCQPVIEVAVDWKHYPYNDTTSSGNDHCYQLNHRGQTWEDAFNTCEGNLLYINDDAEFDFLTKQILEPQAEQSVLWLAGKKLLQETRFSWHLDINITTNISGYTNWGSDGPYQKPYHRDLCIAASYNEGDWTWLNTTCNNRFEFVCKTLKQKTHGGWSEWTEWSLCDRHYKRQRSHICVNPEPFCGGDDCVGDFSEESQCCEEPGEGQHANITYKSIDNTTVYLMPGHYYTYTCDFGYEHSDGSEEKNISCLLSGAWSDPGTAPSCTAKKCPDPADGVHSAYVKTDPNKQFEHLSTVNYDCDNGFAVSKIAGSATAALATCINGDWDVPPLACYAKSCPLSHARLSDAEFGTRYINSVSVRHWNLKSHSSWGWNSTDNDTDLYEDKYQYFCQPGYRVRDKIDYNITCTLSGGWRGFEGSTTNLHPATCEPVLCRGPPPQPITNSLWVNGSDPNNPTISGQYLDRANYKCIAGYQVDTGQVGDTRVLLGYSFTCGANNAWKDEFSPEACVKQSCGDPGPGENIENRVGRTFLYQDTVDYVCKLGHVYNSIITRRRILCELPVNGSFVRWNSTALNCTQVYCGDPGQGKNVTKIGDDYGYGSIVSYTCVPQHVLVGGGLEQLWIRCTSQGTWNGTAPSCEPAEIANDFAVQLLRPYAVQAQWIMSEKYNTILVTFNVDFVGRPAYQMDSNSTAVPYATDNDTDSRFPEHSDTISKTISDSGLIKVLILTKAEHLYEFRLRSVTRVSTEEWPDSRPPIEIYTSGGVPFLGAVQQRNLPNIIPISVLPNYRKRPLASSHSSTSIQVTFSRSMFSEQNGTIIGFTIIVKEVHPWHVTEKTLAKEGYHDRYPQELFTWKQLEVFTDYKYITWPAYYVIPVCNIYNPEANCQKKVGPTPSEDLKFTEGTVIDTGEFKESIYTSFDLSGKSDIDETKFIIGVGVGCEQSARNNTCNGPLRRNRKFCVKLRAYTRYGWNDSYCSSYVQVEKQLEFDKSLIVPTVLAALPFSVFFCIMAGVKYKSKSDTDELEKAVEDGDDDDYSSDGEGQLISTWTMGDKPKIPTARKLANPNVDAAGHSDYLRSIAGQRPKKPKPEKLASVIGSLTSKKGKSTKARLRSTTSNRTVKSSKSTKSVKHNVVGT